METIKVYTELIKGYANTVSFTELVELKNKFGRERFSIKKFKGDLTLKYSCSKDTLTLGKDRLDIYRFFITAREEVLTRFKALLSAKVKASFDDKAQIRKILSAIKTVKSLHRCLSSESLPYLIDHIVWAEHKGYDFWNPIHEHTLKGKLSLGHYSLITFEGTLDCGMPSKKKFLSLKKKLAAGGSFRLAKIYGSHNIVVGTNTVTIGCKTITRKELKNLIDQVEHLYE